MTDTAADEALVRFLMELEVPDWHRQALCRGTATTSDEPNDFFPGPGGNVRVNTAKKTCRACPVQEPCLNYAVDTNQEFGIWGGTAESTRVRLRRERRQGDAA